MIKDIFEKHLWKPEVFETSKEIENFMEINHIYEKKIKKINTIGIAKNMSEYAIECAMGRTLANAGIPYEVIDSGEFKWIDSTLIPCEVIVCEPVVIVFEDNSTLEVMPCDGSKIMVSVNQIHYDVVDGTNHCNYNPDFIFKNIIVSSIRSVSGYIRKDSSIYGYTHNEQHRNSVTFKFWQSLGYDYGLFFRQAWEGWFTVGLFVSNHFNGLDNITATIPYSTLRKAANNKRQICIIEGHDGSSYFWIMPVRHCEPSDEYTYGIEEYYHEEISIEEDDVLHFLYYFLKKYFDNDYDYGISRGEFAKNGFEWNLEYNIYTYDTMSKMLQDIDEKSYLLEHDFDNESILPIIENFNYHDFMPNPLDFITTYTKEEERQIIRDNISIATDFYFRFSKRIRSMMKNAPDYHLISFMGP